MGKKSEDKKKHILDTARKVFCEKGFAAVTMKDIVEAAGISRGGLYLYYESTSEIFLEVMKAESQETDSDFDSIITDDSTVPEILRFFLTEQKKELLHRESSLASATYEFFFANRLPHDENRLQISFDEGVKVLSSLIESGIDAQQIYDVDSNAAALNIMLILEGLKICALTQDLDPLVIDSQIDYIMESLEVKEEDLM